MKGSLIAFLGGALITLQGVANSHISKDIGTWQTATITQLAGFILAFVILLFIRDRNFHLLKQVKPLYLSSGAFGAIIIYSNVMSIHKIGVTLSISALLIAQLCITFLIDITGWFGVVKQKMSPLQFVGITMMILGVIILGY